MRGPKPGHLPGEGGAQHRDGGMRQEGEPALQGGQHLGKGGGKGDQHLRVQEVCPVSSFQGLHRVQTGGRSAAYF